MSAWYKLCFAIFLSTSLNANNAQMVPAGSKTIGKNRFQSAKNYEETIKELKQRFSKKNAERLLSTEINLPHVRAFSLHFTDSAAPFLAVNIYLNISTGITEIFFVEKST